MARYPKDDSLQKVTLNLDREIINALRQMYPTWPLAKVIRHILAATTTQLKDQHHD